VQQKRLEGSRDQSGRVRKFSSSLAFEHFDRPALSKPLSRLTSKGHSTSKFRVAEWRFSDTLLTTYTLQRKPILEKQADASALWKSQIFTQFRIFDKIDVKVGLVTWCKSHTKVSGKWCCVKYKELENKNLENEEFHSPPFWSTCRDIQIHILYFLDLTLKDQHIYAVGFWSRLTQPASFVRSYT
jgi:hypothetical protein